LGTKLGHRHLILSACPEADQNNQNQTTGHFRLDRGVGDALRACVYIPTIKNTYKEQGKDDSKAENISRRTDPANMPLKIHVSVLFFFFLFLLNFIFFLLTTSRVPSTARAPAPPLPRASSRRPPSHAQLGQVGRDAPSRPDSARIWPHFSEYRRKQLARAEISVPPKCEDE
jgi:hypothetical protein